MNNQSWKRLLEHANIQESEPVCYESIRQIYFGFLKSFSEVYTRALISENDAVNVYEKTITTERCHSGEKIRVVRFTAERIQQICNANVKHLGIYFYPTVIQSTTTTLPMTIDDERRDVLPSSSTTMPLDSFLSPIPTHQALYQKQQQQQQQQKQQCVVRLNSISVSTYDILKGHKFTEDLDMVLHSNAYLREQCIREFEFTKQGLRLLLNICECFLLNIGTKLRAIMNHRARGPTRAQSMRLMANDVQLYVEIADRTINVYV